MQYTLMYRTEASQATESYFDGFTLIDWFTAIVARWNGCTDRQHSPAPPFGLGFQAWQPSATPPGVQHSREVKIGALDLCLVRHNCFHSHIGVWPGDCAQVTWFFPVTDNITRWKYQSGLMTPWEYNIYQQYSVKSPSPFLSHDDLMLSAGWQWPRYWVEASGWQRSRQVDHVHNVDKTHSSYL